MGVVKMNGKDTKKLILDEFLKQESLGIPISVLRENLKTSMSLLQIEKEIDFFVMAGIITKIKRGHYRVLSQKERQYNRYFIKQPHEITKDYTHCVNEKEKQEEDWKPSLEDHIRFYGYTHEISNHW